MKSEKIRILFVEDVVTDMELATRELKKENVIFISVRAETREEFLYQLEKFRPDIVISDYSMPTFTGLEVLQITLEKSPNVPVILFTGSINEETAVTCIKAGATDYVLKDKIKRLPFSVKEALVQKEIKQEKEKAEKALIESEERYHLFLDSTQDLVFIKDEKFRYLLINKANRQFIGKEELEIIGKTDYDLMPDKMASNCRNSDIEAIKSSSISVLNEKIGNRTFETRKFPIMLPNGKTGVGGFIRDISSQIETEALLRLHGAALNSVGNAIVITDSKGTILSVNPAFSELTGYSPKEAIGKNPKELVKSGIHSDEFYKELWDTILAGKVWHGEMINRNKAGKFYNEELTITPVHNSEGEITQFVAIKQDITERKIAELAIETSERKYRKLVDNAMIGIYTATLEGDFVSVNEPLCQILEYNTPEELHAVKIPLLYKNLEQRHELINTLLKSGRVMNFETELISKFRNERSVIINAYQEGNHIIGMMLDITDRKKNEIELLKAKEKAEESDRLKTSFLSNMSHEVRTPMNAIQGYAELLTLPEYSESEKHEYVSIISKSSKQLLKIMNDIIEISKIATGLITGNPVKFELNSLLNKVFKEFDAVAASKNLEFLLHCSLSNDASQIILDDVKLNQILCNLIDNAIKFTDKGKIEIGYELKESILEFYVKDTGIGISLENQNIIFERFRQLEDSYNRTQGGSGLGLPISKAFTEYIGGKIWVKSKPGSGSTFFFSVPHIPQVSKPIPDQKPDAELDDFTNFTFLVAEDDDINYVFLERLLMKTHASIIRAANGQEAVDISNSRQDIDIILMDINMPFMNGLEATQLIKEKFPNLPVIAVTAYSLTGDRETCIKAGCDDYLPKPIKRDDLFVKLNQYLNTKGQE